jgi:hypothetical protein
MPLTTDFIPDEPILIIEMFTPADPIKDGIAQLQAAVDFKKKVGGRIVKVLDFTHAEVKFSDMIQAMAAEKGQPGGVNDPDISTVFVALGDMAQIGVEALKEQDQYGDIRNVIGLFQTREEALAAGRAEIAKWPKK